VNGPLVIIDYDAGNLRSVERALVHVGAAPIVSADPATIDAAAGLVLPGVGAAEDTMRNLQVRGLVEPIRAYIDSGRPFLGVCMGLQALLDWSEEGDGVDCLGVVPGEVRRFPAEDGRKVPHMGWNTVEWLYDHPITDGIANGSFFYFVHSYYPVIDDQSYALGMTEYGVHFPSVVARDNVVATQFHPEKSSTDGLRLYANFVRWVEAGSLDALASPETLERVRNGQALAAS
jgi:glutamine amidotransferase